MVIVRLAGGLGNQMFQYALGRRISLLHDVPLKLDLSWFETPELRRGMTPRDYELSHFNIAATQATPVDIVSVLGHEQGSGFRARVSRKLRFYQRTRWL